MTGRLAQAAGARVTVLRNGNGVRSLPGRLATRGRPYTRLRPTSARARSGTGWPAPCQVTSRSSLSCLRPGRAPPIRYTPCSRRTQMPPRRCAGPTISSSSGRIRAQRLAALLGSPAEQDLLGLLSWLPVRVAAAARRRRPDELPALPGADRGRVAASASRPRQRCRSVARPRRRARVGQRAAGAGRCRSGRAGGRTGADRHHGQRPALAHHDRRHVSAQHL